MTGVLLVRKLRAARGATRRALAPVLLTSAVAILLFVPYLIVDAAGGQVEDAPLSWVGGAFTAIPIAFLFGLLRTRLQRSGVADLIVELRSLSRPDDVRDAIARALGDPSLELAFWLPGTSATSIPAGAPRPGHARRPRRHCPRARRRPSPPSSTTRRSWTTPNSYRPSPACKPHVRERPTAGGTPHPAHRGTGLRHASSKPGRRTTTDQRDLHDGAQQRLLGIRLALQLARGRLADGDGAVDELLTEADGEVGGALDELHALARGIHPALLPTKDLRRPRRPRATRTVPIELTVSPGRCSPPVEATAYFVASEALANVAKHAHASQATIDVSRTNGRVCDQGHDDGVGGADAAGTGLHGLRARVEAVDGRLRVQTRPRTARGSRRSSHAGDPRGRRRVVREGIARLLAESGVEVLGQVDTGEQLVQLVATDPPDVAVVDMPKGLRVDLALESATGRVYQTGAPSRVDSYDEIEAERIDGPLRALGIHAAVAAPIVVDARIWGSISLSTVSDRPSRRARSCGWARLRSSSARRSPMRRPGAS